ncbi:hypothetical protein [Dactylosporangium matsuzakiense]|uniref:hypothetical protein n=1 Tax=Dactylosporangium matsuzakiense TaxID=53360 RepID=UPI0021C4898B|nr:hypothetical protein [Dactylosporangium matsuzakiense]UWZ45444.1 hypothetical protein Dmats_02535 [Dactylosporangium matsuzakiense]
MRRGGDRVVVWSLMAASAVLYAIAANLRFWMEPLGDEPHYLVMSVALGKYHTFDLTQAYANGDWRAFYADPLDAHVYPNAEGIMVPLHNFGGPILWTVPFQLWGRPGAAAVVVLASVLAVGVTYRLQRELGITQVYAGVVTGLFAVGTPLYMYASMQFVDPFGALFTAYAALIVVRADPKWWQVGLASAGLGWMPWVHGRFLLLTIPLGLLLAMRKHRALALAPMLGLVLALELFNFTQYHSLSPAPGNAALGDGLLQISPWTGLAGILFDRQYGLISHFPLLALAVPGMFLAPRRSPHWALLAAIVPYILAVSTFRTWWAGYTPPGRLPVVLVPLLAYYVALTLQSRPRWLPPTLAALTAAFAFAYTLTGDLYPLRRFTSSNGPGVDRILDEQAAGLGLPDLPTWWPTVETVPGTGQNPWPWYCGYAAFAALMVLWSRSTRPRPSTPADAEQYERVPDR